MERDLDQPNLEMHGQGTFFDPRLDNAQQFPIAARNRFGHLRTPPDQDRITPKLAALHFYQLSLPVPVPRPGEDFSPQAAQRGDELFSGKARFNECHVEPLWTEPGWNLHKAEEIGIDSFQAERASDHAYKTQNLAGLFIRERGLFMNPANKGRFFHDGRFAILLDVVNHYNIHFNLQLTDNEKLDLVNTWSRCWNRRLSRQTIARGYGLSGRRTLTAALGTRLGGRTTSTITAPAAITATTVTLAAGHSVSATFTFASTLAFASTRAFASTGTFSATLAFASARSFSAASARRAGLCPRLAGTCPFSPALAFPAALRGLRGATASAKSCALSRALSRRLF